jgi:putative tricarboxylic transport membrane protein
VSEILVNLEESQSYTVIKTGIRNLFPSIKDWAQSKWPIMRGTLIGFLLGIIPGGGAIVSSFVSYTVEKKLSRYPERFGTGVIEGVAGPESANNSACSGAFIPLFALGIPPNVVIALLMGALLIHGVTPGPLTMKEHPEIFWGTVSSMYIGNVLLLILNIPLIAIWVRILKVPYHILYPLILLFCLIGTYSVNSLTDELIVMTVFGVIGYLAKKFDFEMAPLILAYVLGPIFEQSFRQSLIISDGSFSIFITRPISAFLILIAAILLFTALLAALKRKRKKG